MTLFYHIPLTCWVCSIAVLQVTNYATVEGLGTRLFEMLLAKGELEDDFQECLPVHVVCIRLKVQNLY